MNNNNLQNHEPQQENLLDLIARTVNQHTDILNKHTVQLDRLTIAVMQNTEDVEWIKEKMAKKADIDNLENTLDQILGLMKKKDQELTFMGERIKRIEDDVKRMKPVGGLF